MIKHIEAIETEYSGIKFRSRLEARWAVFFDQLGIEWEYEEEGYKLSDGTWYLPDFHLPTFNGGIYVEVKPSRSDFSRAIQFCNDIGKGVWLAESSPAIALYRIVDSGGGFYCGIPNWDQAYEHDRMYVMPCCFKGCRRFCDGSIGNLFRLTLDDENLELFRRCDIDGFVEKAVNKARSARFEFGCCG